MGHTGAEAIARHRIQRTERMIRDLLDARLGGIIEGGRVLGDSLGGLSRPILIVQPSAPTPPAAGTVTVYVRNVAGVPTLFYLGNDGVERQAGTDAEIVRDVIGTALVAGPGISVAVDDPGNTITIRSAGGSLTYAFLTDSDGAYLTDSDGAYLVEGT